MEIPDGMGATLPEYVSKKGLKILERPVGQSIRQAALHVLLATIPIDVRSSENWQLMLALHGNPWELPYPDYLPVIAGVYDNGCLGWNPGEDRLGCVTTPVVKCHPYLRELATVSPNEWLSITVMFVNCVAQPLAVVTMMCLEQPKTPHKWDLHAMTLFGMDSCGEAIDRPIFITPHPEGGFMAQLTTVTIGGASHHDL